MRRPWRTVALLACLLLPAGCIDGGGTPADPSAQASATARPQINLSDVSVGSPALAQRAGLYICGRNIVASAPAGGIESDSFVVFDGQTGVGEITRVELPRGLRPNARWLLTTECVVPAGGGEPFVSVAYQEMPLAPEGGEGVRAAYSLDGEQLWMRSDINQPGIVVDDVLVLGATPEQPDTAVDLRTGEIVATFDPSVQARTVVSGERMVVRGLTGPPVLTTLAGEPITKLRQATSYTAEGGFLFGSTPAALPDSDPADESTVEEGTRDLTDASPSPSPTQSAPPAPRSGLFRGEVRAYSLRTGEPQWKLNVAPDPLGVPTVERETGIVVVVDVDGVAHGIDPQTGRQEWRTPTELENPRVTAAAGIVLFDKIDEPFQKLADARTGLPLPEPEESIVDLKAAGALQIIDGVPTLVPPRRLRTPPSTEQPTD